MMDKIKGFFIKDDGKPNWVKIGGVIVALGTFVTIIYKKFKKPTTKAKR